jgi:gag-polypeptide of LTR copia-type
MTNKLTSIILDGKNYNVWAIQTSFGLIGREKLEYVNGEITMSVPKITGAPTDDEKKSSENGRRMTIELLGGS